MAVHDPGEDDRDESRRRQVQGALKSLAVKHQNVITLRYFMNLTFEEIGEILGCRQEAVRVRLSRAIAAMRRQLGVQAEHRA